MCVYVHALNMHVHICRRACLHTHTWLNSVTWSNDSHLLEYTGPSEKVSDFTTKARNPPQTEVLKILLGSPLEGTVYTGTASLRELSQCYNTYKMDVHLEACTRKEQWSQ